MAQGTIWESTEIIFDHGDFGIQRKEGDPKDTLYVLVTSHREIFPEGLSFSDFAFVLFTMIC